MKGFIVAVILFPLFATAQNKLKAVIKDIDTKESLSSVSVLNKKMKMTAISDSNGMILISKIPDGKR